MISSGFASFQKQLRQAKSLFHLNEWVRNQKISLPSDAELGIPISERSDYSRYFDYSGALTRLYASYEAYVFSTIGIWLRFLSSTSYSLLSAKELDELRDSYRVNVGFCLQYLSQKRLESIGAQKLLFSTLKTLRGRLNESLIPEVFFSNLNNLRLQDLVALLGQVKMGDGANFLAQRNYIRDFLEGTGHTLDSYLKDFVQRRNEVSHGNNVGDLLGLSSLIEISDFLEHLGRAISELVLTNMLRSPKCVPIGTYEKRYKSKKVLILRSNSEVVSVTDYLIIQSGSSPVVGRVESIEIEGNPLAATTPGENDLVGIRLSETPPASGCVYRVLSPASSFL